MAKLRIQLNHAGIRQLLQSDGVVEVLKKKGEAVAAAAGPGHEVQVYIGKNRARVTVRTATFAAMQNEASHQTLTRALDAART